MAKNASTADGWDEEYRAGRWSFLRDLPESGRYGIIGMWLSLTETLDSVLDIGCGEGLLYERLQPMGIKRYVGVDLAPAALNIATQCDGPLRTAKCVQRCRTYRPLCGLPMHVTSTLQNPM